MTGVPTLVIGGTHSGVGKTSVALGLMRAFSRRGLRVQAFKVGPDFIDPGHHTLATGRRSHNLDGWMIPPAVNQKIFRDATQDADLAIVEGVMGLFDGYGMGEQGSTAELAKLLGASVVLVMDAQGMGRSAAALLQGFQRFDPAVNFLGAILNRVGSDRHRAWIQRACEADNLQQAQNLENDTMAILGGLPRQDALHIPRRHLGLVLGGEDETDPEDGDRLDRLGQWVEHYLDLDQLYHSAKTYPAKTSLDRTSLDRTADGASWVGSFPRGSTVKIGVARDRAFCFHYEYNLALLRNLGAELVEFSPLTASRLPDGLCGLYFAGGYPELHAEMLSHNRPLRQQIADLSRAGLPIYGECGGLMYLSQGVTDAAGNRSPMVGALPFEIVMGDRPTLGYKEVQWTGPDGWFPPDVTARGHCFHYSQLSIASPTPALGYGYRLKSSQCKVQQEGYLHRNTLASYVHLHWGSCPDWARSWLELCRRCSIIS